MDEGNNEKIRGLVEAFKHNHKKLLMDQWYKGALDVLGALDETVEDIAFERNISVEDMKAMIKRFKNHMKKDRESYSG